MVRRGIDIDAHLMGRPGDRVVPQRHAAIVQEESIAARQCRVVVGDRKPGDRRSGAGEYRNAEASGGSGRLPPPPTMLVPPPLLVSLPVSSTPRGAVVGKGSLFPTL